MRSTFLRGCFFFLLYEAAITFAGVDKMLECGHFGQQEIAVK